MTLLTPAACVVALGTVTVIEPPPSGAQPSGPQPSGVVAALEPTASEVQAEAAATPGAGTAGRTRKLRAYLQRPRMPSARHLDHGTLSVGLAGGAPHKYRVSLGLGILDHVSLGVTANWLPGETRPDWSPLASVAFWRGRMLEVGAWYHQGLHPRSETANLSDQDPNTVRWRQETHWLLSAVSFSQDWWSGGFDFGWVRGRDRDPLAEANNPDTAEFVVRDRIGGGLHLRLGTRRWGFTGTMLWPYFTGELAFDLRFGLFEMRPRGGWRLRDML